MTTERLRLFGDDLRLSARAGKLDLVSDRAGDLDLASGADNIAQALMLRLMIRQRELTPLGWPDFGSRLHELLGAPNNDRTRIIAMAHAKNAIERDPRVSEVLQIHATPEERFVVRIEVEVQLIHRSNPMNLVYPLNLETS